MRGLHSLGEQKNPRRSWYYTKISSYRRPYTSFINLNIFIGIITFIVPTNILRPHPAVNPTTFVDLSTFVGFDRYRRQYSLRRLFSKPNSQSLYICFYRIPYNILAQALYTSTLCLTTFVSPRHAVYIIRSSLLLLIVCFVFFQKILNKTCQDLLPNLKHLKKVCNFAFARCISEALKRRDDAAFKTKEFFVQNKKNG